MSYPTAIITKVNNPRLCLLNMLQREEKPIMTFMGLPYFPHCSGCCNVRGGPTSAIAAQNVSPIVRIRMTYRDLIKRALDAGAHGIVVPQINTAEEARSVVSHSKFPPQGFRGQGSPFPGIAHGTDIPTYMKTANGTIITCLQIETKEGLENVDSICAVPGVGPNDLALSLLGYVPAKGDEPEFVQAIDKIVAAARKHGKWVSRLSNDGNAAKDHLEVFDTIALSYDVRAIQNWYKAELKTARS
ncbi:2-4-dihydroxyhept-2-ene-1-7-dioic acid aldolase [Penicillium citrinum]|uniref:2-4-dihydroxyhept-2-ene-1-7-dioic acid aldolase n=1 Tax=Penicillium citrinum TaxID=5077 RepID=A0A9W9P4S4_PENCI|nr:2-4-dihydroxyhept-2-ene-1-7-dioic acid aldolase [Penicillium citrinum]KAJ5235441.1 2-4-dihydroxyhept-2-ene-1-7-dioic acid aldolase [Penicillium citrinum]